jgi:hypothetical protein
MTGEISPRTHIVLLALLAVLPTWHAMTTPYDGVRYVSVASVVMIAAVVGWKIARYRGAR